VENLAAAVRFPTVSHQDESRMDAEAFLGLHRWLRGTYPRVFSELQVEVVNDYSLLLIWPGRDASLAPVLFTSHLDVVPIEAGTEADWQHPPFAGVVEDGYLFGRGTLDDKVGVISLLEAAESLLQQGYSPRRTLVFGFGHDEEIGGQQGAGRLAARMREKNLHFDWMVDEGSFPVRDNPLTPGRPTVLIGVAEKAYLTLVLTARGSGGHSSMPPPHTTIGRLAEAVTRVENSPFATKLVPPVDTMLERAAPLTGFPTNLVLSNLWLTEPLVTHLLSRDPLTNSYVRTTTAVTMFHAGVKENVIPQSAEAYINFRLLPGDTPEMVIEHVRRVVDDPGIEIGRSRDWADPPPLAAMSGGGFDVIGAAALAVFPDAAVLPMMMSATTDVRHYIDLADNHYRFHGAMMSTAQASGIHGTNERIEVESFVTAVQVAQGMLRGAGAGNPKQCTEPRPEICTMEYAPVCASLASGERREYSNGCSACADPEVLSHVSGPCSGDAPES
jgi:carboxypeptidase PM20D1